MTFCQQLMRVSASVCLLATTHALAFNWNTKDYGGTGSWRDADHWSPKGNVPGAVDGANTSVFIDAPQSGMEASVVSLPCCASISVNLLSIGPRTSPLPPSIVGENMLTIGDSMALGFLRNDLNPHPKIDNAGVINLYGWLSSGNEVLDQTEIDGPGKIVMWGTGQHFMGQFQNRQVIEGQGDIMGFMSNQGTIRATHGQTLRIYAATYNEGGVLTTDGYADGLTTSALLIGASVEGGRIVANSALVRFVTSGMIKNVTLAGGPMVVEWPGLKLSDTNTIQPDGVLSSAAAGVQSGSGSIEMRLLDLATLVNNGIIRLESSTYENQLLVPDKSSQAGSVATLTGTGRLILKGDANYLRIGPRSDLEHGTNHTIEGAGTIVDGFLANHGQIIAKDGILKISSRVWNFGSMGASSNAILELTSDATITRDAAGPGILSPGGGKIRLTGATVVNGEWGDGNIEFYYSIYSSPAVTLSGTNHFSSNSIVDFVSNSSGLNSGIAVSPGTNTIVNDGIIRMNGNAALYSGDKSGTITSLVLLKGFGKLILAPGNYTPSLEGYSGSRFINDKNHTIQGSGNLRAPLENRGTIIVESGYLQVSQPLTGQGNIQVRNSGKLYLAANLQAGNLGMDAGSLLDNNYNGKTIELTGDFFFSQTDEAKWYRGNPIMKMNGSQGVQKLEIGSLDQGAAWAGFNNPNFQMQSLTIESNGTRVALVDSIDNGNRSSAEALYARALYVNPGATLNLNGLSLYTLLTNNPHRVIAGEGGLFGGGLIVDVPEPASITLVPHGSLKGNAFQFTVAWPSSSTGWMLQQNTNGVSSPNWINVFDTIQDDGTNKVFIVNPAIGNRFYRLSQ